MERVNYVQVKAYLVKVGISVLCVPVDSPMRKELNVFLARQDRNIGVPNVLLVQKANMKHWEGVWIVQLEHIKANGVKLLVMHAIRGSIKTKWVKHYVKIV